MANLSGIITPTNVLTATSTNTVTNKTINIANNTLTGVQPTLVSGTNIKTINGGSVLGSGNLAVGGGAMVLLSTVTASSSSSITFTGVTSAYDVYVIQCPDLAVSSGTSAELYMRHTVGGVPDATANAYENTGGTMQTSWAYSTISFTAALFGRNSFLQTTKNSIYIQIGLGSGVQDYYATVTNTAGRLQLCVAKSQRSVTVDGFVLFPGVGTITGAFRLYGIKNS